MSQMRSWVSQNPLALAYIVTCEGLKSATVTVILLPPQQLPTVLLTACHHPHALEAGQHAEHLLHKILFDCLQPISL